MNLRKFFNYPDTKQKSLISNDINTIMKKCGDIAYAEQREQRDLKIRHDSKCQNGKCKSNDIVNKIRDVQGRGNVSGTFYLGFGDVSGNLMVDTLEVNHCNVCGHEWRKFKEKSISSEQILVVALNYLADILTKPIEKEDFPWKADAIKVFDDCCAESIYSLVIKNKSNIFINTASKLNRNQLRKHYKSVFDN
jgi:hypothetical protein